MSALGLAIAATSPMGAASAAKRGEVAAAADFAAILDANSANEAAGTPAVQKADTNAAPAEIVPEDADLAASDILVSETPVAADPVIAPPAPLIVATPPAGIEADAPAAAAPTDPDAPLPASPPSGAEAEAGAPLPPSNEADATSVAPQAAPRKLPAEASRSADRESVKTDAPAADTPSKDARPTAEPAAGLPPTPKAEVPTARADARASATLAAAMAALIAPPARASATVAAADAPAAAEAATAGPVVAEDSPTPSQPTAPAAEALRIRDVIERAPVRATPTAATDVQAAPVTQAASASTTDAKAAASATAATTATPPPAAAIASTLVPIPTDIEAVAAPVGQAAQPTAERPLDVATPPSAPSASRASIETTVHIAAQIVRKLEGRSSRFEMALTPEGLGNVDVSLDIDADGKLIAKLAFDNPLAATEMRGRVDELRRQLQDSGFVVADDALSFTERDPSTGQGAAFDRRPDPRNARAFGAASRLEADADQLSVSARWIPLTLTPDRVDMKV